MSVIRIPIWKLRLRPGVVRLVLHGDFRAVEELRRSGASEIVDTPSALADLLLAERQN